MYSQKYYTTQTLYENKRGQITWASSSHHAKYRTQGFLWSQDVDVVENTPRTLPRDHVTFGHYGCCATSGCVHSREPRRGQVTFGSYVTTTKKKARGKKTGHAQNILPVRTASGQGLFRSRDFVTSGQKAPLGWIWHNLRLRMRRIYLRTMHVTGITSGHVTDVTSGHVTSGHMTSGSTTANTN